MAYVCFNCGKGSNYGTQHRHRPGVAGRQHYRRAHHTPKQFRPNLQAAYIIENNHTERVLLCTKCRRLLKEEGKIKVWTKESTVKPEVKKATVTKDSALKVEPKEVKPQKKEETKKKTEKKAVKEVNKPAKTEKVKEKEAPKAPTISVEDLVGKKK